MRTPGIARLLSVSSAAIVLGLPLSAADYHKTYREYCERHDTQDRFSIGVQPKGERLKSYAGIIIADYPDDMPDEIRTCARLAVDIWESAITTTTPIRIKIGYAPLEAYDGIEQMTSADVRFILDDETGLCYPSSLYRQTHDVDDQEYDAVITVNSDIPMEAWNFSHRPQSQHFGYFNATTLVMKSIGRALGFGSAIDYSEDTPYLALPALTPYDTAIEFKDNEAASLADLGLRQGVPSEELREQLTRDAMFDSQLSVRTRLRSGKFHGGAGLNHLDFSSSLFSAGRASAYQVIDGTLSEVMKRIGWKSEKPVFGIYQPNTGSDNGLIVSDDFFYLYCDETEVLSYPLDSTLTLRFRKNDGTWSSDRWSPFDPGLDGLDTSGLELNVNGDIYGVVDGTYTVEEIGTKKPITYPVNYRMSLEQTPRIASTRLVSYDGKSTDGQTLQNYVLVTYSGADNLIVKLSDSRGFSDTFLIDEPYVAAVDLSRCADGADISLTITAANKHGIATEEMHISHETIAAIDAVTDTPTGWDRMEVYDLNGRIVGESTTCLPKGIYIVAFYNGSTIVDRKKISI